MAASRNVRPDELGENVCHEPPIPALIFGLYVARVRLIPNYAALIRDLAERISGRRSRMASTDIR